MDHVIRELLGGLKRMAIHKEGHSYFPDGGFGEPFNYPRSGWVRTDEAAGETEGGEGSVVAYQGHPIQALARWYALSGDDQALDFAGRLTRYCMLPKFWGGLPDPEKKGEGLVGHVSSALPDPACVSGAEQGHWYSHFHARAIALRGILEYAMQAHDAAVVEFVRRAYEYTLTFGIPRMGWINCYPVAVNQMEGCALGDLVALGVRLSDAGVGDYWDDVDAIVRNHLVEGQLVRGDILERVAAASPDGGEEVARAAGTPLARRYLTEDVIKRSLGNFAGNTAPSHIARPWVMTCCTGNGTQGLYYAWEATLRQNRDTAQVNLLLNRAGKLVDVDSYLPFEGKVCIRSKGAPRVSVRVPSWVNRRDLTVAVNGRARPLVWVGNYVFVDGLKSGDGITLEFPTGETTARYTVNARTKDERTYRCVFRGSTLVDISPRDDAPTNYPLYVREHVRKDRAPMKKTSRFVSERTILRW